MPTVKTLGPEPPRQSAMQQRAADEQPKTRRIGRSLSLRLRSALSAISNRADRGGKRVALFTPINHGKRPFELAVSFIDAQSYALPGSRMPCRTCRQVMQELLPASAAIHIDGVGTRGVQQLLLEGFELSPEGK